MILGVRVNNYLVYSNKVELSLKADMHIKKFISNIHKENNFQVLKSACIYGANNSGKTCLIRAINSIRTVLMGKIAEVPYNLFTDSKCCELGISFLQNGHAYRYDFKYDLDVVKSFKKGFIYERLAELFIDKYGNYSEKEIFIRDVENSKYNFNGDTELSDVLGLVSNDNILIYTINTTKYPIVEEYKQLLRNFAERIDIIDMNNIPIDKTIAVLKNDDKLREKTVEMIKFADLDIDDYQYIKSNRTFSISGNNPPIQEEALKMTIALDDMLSLTSVHRGKPVQSLTFDSTGTKKIVAVASYVMDALINGKILIIDELDNSLHFKLTRAIVALFNNDLNLNGQLIFTAHDMTLLDCKTLFRKDQIWFASKDPEREYLYSLAQFTAKESKIRSESNLFEKYNAGVLGAVPDPDFISILLSDGEDEEA